MPINFQIDPNFGNLDSMQSFSYLLHENMLNRVETKLNKAFSGLELMQ